MFDQSQQFETFININAERKNINEEYILIEQIGSGTFSKVYKAIHKQSDQLCALKVLNIKTINQHTLQNLQQECNILQSLNHKNIIGFYSLEIFETQLAIKMQLAEGASLSNLIESKLNSNSWFSEEEVKLIMENIWAGIEYFHQQNIVHHDLKPENILLIDKNDYSTIKIADFGLGVAFQNTQKIHSSFRGTMVYMAPEQFLNKVHSKPVDIWASGIIMFQLLNKGEFPFQINENSKDTLKDMLQQWNIQKLKSNSSDISINLMQKILAFNPEDRYNAGQCFCHKWISNKEQLQPTLGENVKFFGFVQKIHQIIQVLMIIKQCQSSRYKDEGYKKKCMEYAQQNSRKEMEIFDEKLFKSYYNEYLSKDKEEKKQLKTKKFQLGILTRGSELMHQSSIQEQNSLQNEIESKSAMLGNIQTKNNEEIAQARENLIEINQITKTVEESIIIEKNFESKSISKLKKKKRKKDKINSKATVHSYSKNLIQVESYQKKQQSKRVIAISNSPKLITLPPLQLNKLQKPKENQPYIEYPMEMNNENSLLDKSMNSPMELVSRWRRKQRTVITDNSFRELDNQDIQKLQTKLSIQQFEQIEQPQIQCKQQIQDKSTLPTIPQNSYRNNDKIGRVYTRSRIEQQSVEMNSETLEYIRKYQKQLANYQEEIKSFRIVALQPQSTQLRKQNKLHSLKHVIQKRPLFQHLSVQNQL